MTVLRRAITVSAMTILMVMVLVSGPLLLAGAGVVGLAARSSRPARTVALLMAYAVIELRTLVKVLRGNRDCDQLMHDFLVSTYAAVHRILDVEVVLEPASAKPDAIPRDEPVIVLSRHCGPGDSVLVAWLIAIEYRLRLRIVLKAVLQCEPVLDFAGELGCLCFLSRGDRARGQIRDMAESLVGGQALLLFPEGANFSWPRWRNAVIKLRSTGGFGAARRALRQSHTLPPRSGGAAAAVPTGGPGPGGSYPFTDSCSSAQLWSQLLIFHRRIGWNPGSHRPGPKSMPGWQLMPSHPDVSRRPSRRRASCPDPDRPQDRRCERTRHRS
jgi:1-acyl-sn-glycerol-3-phosphate acyltransferase